MRNIIKEFIGSLKLEVLKLNFVSKSTVYKYNQGYLYIGTINIITLTSEYINVKYNWFQEYVEIDFVVEKTYSKNKGEGVSLRYFRGIS